MPIICNNYQNTGQQDLIIQKKRKKINQPPSEGGHMLNSICLKEGLFPIYTELGESTYAI